MSDLPNKAAQQQLGSEGIDSENASSRDASVAPEEGTADEEDQPLATE